MAVVSSPYGRALPPRGEVGEVTCFSTVYARAGVAAPYGANVSKWRGAPTSTRPVSNRGPQGLAVSAHGAKRPLVVRHAHEPTGRQWSEGLRGSPY
jgi:hypothetical protein